MHYKPFSMATMTCLMLASSSALAAHDNQLSLSSDDAACATNIINTLEVNKRDITLTNAQGETLTLEENGQVLMQQTPISLPAEQRQKYHEYRRGVVAAGANLSELVGTSLDIAVQTVDTAFMSIVESDHPSMKTIRRQAADVSQAIQQKFYDQEGELSFTVSPDDTDNQQSQTVNLDVDLVVEDFVKTLVPNLITVVMDSELSFLEMISRTAKVSENVGAKVEQQFAKHVEPSIAGFCQQIHAIDKLESELIKMDPRFASFQILEISSMQVQQ